MGVIFYWDSAPSICTSSLPALSLSSWITGQFIKVVIPSTWHVLYICIYMFYILVAPINHFGRYTRFKDDTVLRRVTPCDWLWGAIFNVHCETYLATTQPMTPLPRELYLCPLTGPVCRRRRKWLYWAQYKHYINPTGSLPATLPFAFIPNSLPLLLASW